MQFFDGLAAKFIKEDLKEVLWKGKEHLKWTSARGRDSLKENFWEMRSRELML